MATSYALLFCNLAFVILFPSSIAQSSYVTAYSDLVDGICSPSPDYEFFKFCRDALNSDPRTPGADVPTLGKVAFGLVLRNASSTQHQITWLLNNSTGPVHHHLRQCHGDYATAIAKAQEALTDLDLERYDNLSFLPFMVGDQADKCESAFKGTKSPLTKSNKDLEMLSGICVAIAEALTV